ncbi:Isochorismatase-like protein [Dactylonectria macrodidyma]|uniref:Isochorismatase-like protein n=1 Tax=Dactylonectria macrodidyma TaxID=307937 RepID=A0A9P9JR57_9HYPO|nr:Isochorismatase-like protein [Dactylonectria macrodidyma]
MAPGLIIIDLQNDFVSPTGTLGERHIPLSKLLPRLRTLCAVSKSRSLPIVAIRSEYTPVQNVERPNPTKPVRSLSRPLGDKYRTAPLNDDHLSGTNQGTFCVPGSDGAGFPREVRQLVDEYCSTVITKGWYSAFTETSLHGWLQEHGVEHGPLFFAGVTANNCVLASLTDGFFHGYQVRAVSDCIASLNQKREKEAYKKITTYYGSVVSSSDAIVEVLGLSATRDIESQARDEPVIASPAQMPSEPRRTLYWVNGSVPSWRVMMILAYKRLPYTARRLHVMTNPKETRAAEFKALNPRCKTPVLIDEDGMVITESMAICQYLETHYPESGDGPLMPDPRGEKKKHTHVLEKFFESENAHYIFDSIEFLFKKDPSGAELEAAREAYENTLNELAFWEDHLAESAFISGHELSLADVAFYPSLAYMVHRGYAFENELPRREGDDAGDQGNESQGVGFPRLKEYYERVHALRCAHEACPIKWETPGKVNLFKQARELCIKAGCQGRDVDEKSKEV